MKPSYGSNATLGEFNRDVDARDLSRADGLNKTLATLVLQREILAKLPTWPWSTATLRGFVTGAPSPDRALPHPAGPQPSVLGIGTGAEASAGSTLWFRWKTLVGSQARLRTRRRSSLASP